MSSKQSKWLFIIGGFVFGLFQGGATVPGFDAILNNMDNVVVIIAVSSIFGFMVTGVLLSSQNRNERQYTSYFGLLSFCLGVCLTSGLVLLTEGPTGPLLVMCGPIGLVMILMGVVNELFNKGT